MASRGTRVGAIAVAVVTLGVSSAQGAVGDLSQSGGSGGCLAATAGEGCRVARAARGTDLETSPDGRHLYVASSVGIGILERARNGSLRQSPQRYSCFSSFADPCRPLPLGGDFLQGMEITPDGRHAYILSGSAQGVLAFKRDPRTGALKQLAGKSGCLTAQGRSDDSDPATAGDCADAPSLANVSSIAVAPDGRNVYVGGGFTTKSISVLDRNPRTGRLSQRAGEAGCVSEVVAACRDSVGTDLVTALAFDSKGRHLYATARNSDAITIFNRARNGSLTQKSGEAGCVNNVGNGCEDGRGLDTAVDLAVSPDDRHVYAVARGSTLTLFDRHRQTGAIDQRPESTACLAEAEGPAIAGCAPARLLGTADEIAVSRDGRSVYALADGSVQTSRGISIFRRSPKTGLLAQPNGPAGCFSSNGRSDPDDPSSAGDCRDGRLFGPLGELVISPDDGAVYSNDSNQGIDVLQRKAQRCGGKRVTLMGTPLGDRLRGTSSKDVIAGLDGNDRIKGLAGRDRLCGGKGNDRLDGGTGRDRCSGAAGRDRLRGCE